MKSKQIAKLVVWHVAHRKRYPHSPSDFCVHWNDMPEDMCTKAFIVCKLVDCWRRRGVGCVGGAVVVPLRDTKLKAFKTTW
jgi:hypothetical protein